MIGETTLTEIVLTEKRLAENLFKTKEMPTTGRVSSRHLLWFAPHTLIIIVNLWGDVIPSKAIFNQNFLWP